MYVNSAYWHNKVLDFKDKSKPIMVCSCGTYHLFTRPKLPTHRPRGRLDWQILYIASGKAHFYFNGVEEIDGILRLRNLPALPWKKLIPWL